MGNILTKCPKCGANNDSEGEGAGFLKEITCSFCGFVYKKDIRKFLVTTPDPKPKDSNHPWNTLGVS